MDLYAAVRVGEDPIHRRRETRRVAHRLGTGRKRPVVELAIRDETRDLDQTAPYVASGAHQVEERILREHGPTLTLPALERLVENRGRHPYDDEARDEAREECVTRPESVVRKIPRDRAAKDEDTQEAEDACRTHVRPRRIGAARTGCVRSHPRRG